MFRLPDLGRRHPQRNESARARDGAARGQSRAEIPTPMRFAEYTAIRHFMSKHGSWRTRKYWEAIGGFLIEEFLAIPPTKDKSVGKRLIDGVIILGTAKGSQVGGTFDLRDKDIIVVQTKSNRLGMYLMGQAFFSKQIMRRFKPKSIRTVAICGESDKEMELLCKANEIEVVVIKDNEKNAL